jgi:hypothetical protein
VPASTFDPRRTLAIMLGARVFPRSPSLELHGTRFSNSALAFRQYLETILGIPRRCILDLFDDNRSPSDILNDISASLTRHLAEMRNNNTPVQDLLFYYVGHGFLEGKNISDLCLAIRATDVDDLQITTLEMQRLAGVIRSRARFQRRYLILDCCYGAAASRAWSQSEGPAKLAMRSLLSLFPDESPSHGTAVLSAAESNKEANAIGKRGLTTFSDALLECLKNGRSELGERVSLNSLHAMILEYLKDNYSDTDKFVRPKVESPEASEGDVALFPVFPNPLFGQSENLGFSGDKAQQQDDALKRAEAVQHTEEERLKAVAAQREQEEHLKAETAQREQEEARRSKAEQEAVRRENAEERSSSSTIDLSYYSRQRVAEREQEAAKKAEGAQREQELLRVEAAQRDRDERLKPEAVQREIEEQRLKAEVVQREIEEQRLKAEAAHRETEHRRNQVALDRQLAEQLYQKLMRQSSNGEIKTMIPGLRTIIKLNPEHAKAHRDLAEELKRLAQLDEALAEARLAMRLGPIDESSLRLHGEIVAAMRKSSADQGAFRHLSTGIGEEHQSERMATEQTRTGSKTTSSGRKFSGMIGAVLLTGGILFSGLGLKVLSVDHDSAVLALLFGIILVSIGGTMLWFSQKGLKK